MYKDRFTKMVSVIIPTYRRMGDVVDNAIKSVLFQTYKNIEIIVVDDNGDPNSVFSVDVKSVISNYPNVTYINLPKNSGACVARNAGIVAAKGEYVAFLDDDDSWAPDKIERQVKLFSDKTGFVYCGLDLYFEDSGKKQLKKAKIRKRPIIHLLKNNYIGSTSCGIVKKTIAIESGLFDEKLKSGQDLDFWIRLLEKTDCDCVEDCLVHYTFYSQGTITKNYRNRLFSNIYLRKKYENYFKQNLSLRILYRLKIFKAFLLNGMIKDGLMHLFFGKVKKEYEI